MTTSTPRRSDAVQSLQRAFGLLETMADRGGVLGLSQLAEASGLPVPTIHRLLRTLTTLGYLRQDTDRRYALGPRLIRLGEGSTRALSVWARPHLAALAADLGESANLATLDGNEVVYVAQQQSSHTMRMFTEVGQRVLPHCTAVGKTLLAGWPVDRVRTLLQRTGMPQYTEHTLTDPDEFITELVRTAERGYALDEGEQEIGVRCVAVTVPTTMTSLAISLSGPAIRMTEALINRAVPQLLHAAAALATDIE